MYLYAAFIILFKAQLDFEHKVMRSNAFNSKIFILQEVFSLWPYPFTTESMHCGFAVCFFSFTFFSFILFNFKFNNSKFCNIPYISLGFSTWKIFRFFARITTLVVPWRLTCWHTQNLCHKYTHFNKTSFYFCLVLYFPEKLQPSWFLFYYFLSASDC